MYRYLENDDLEALRGLSFPAGPWLDVGCGLGEWMELADRAGRSVKGIDANSGAVGHCRANGLDVSQGDAVEYLGGVPAGSFAVITAFHFIEHLSPNYVLSFVQQAAAALKPGGLLILETPDPSNLTVSSHQFWRDLTHQRPIPPYLLVLILEYFNLELVERFHLNPAPADEWLSFRELEFVERLNQILYGPQDYGVIGRK